MHNTTFDPDPRVVLLGVLVVVAVVIANIFAVAWLLMLLAGAFGFTTVSFGKALLAAIGLQFVGGLLSRR